MSTQIRGNVQFLGGIILDATTKSLEIKLAGAITTTQLPFVASYFDSDQSAFVLTGSGEADGTTNSGTAVTAVAAPAASTTRKLISLSVVNVDTAAATLTIQVNNNSTTRIVFKVALAVGDQVAYADGCGWAIFDANGNRKMITAPAAAGTLTGTVLAANVVTSSLTSVGTITVGVWNAGAVTSSGNITGNGSGVVEFAAVSSGSDAQFRTNCAAGAAAQWAIYRGGVYKWSVGAAAASNVDDFQWYDRVGSALRMSLTNAGLLTVFGTGKHVFGGTMQISGYGAGTAAFDASGNITSVSDRRFKDRIAPLGYGLAEVLKLRPVRHGYNKKSGLERKYLYGGFLAQNVKKAIPLAVGRDQRGYLTLSDRPILGATVHAIQELHARLARLEGKRA